MATHLLIGVGSAAAAACCLDGGAVLQALDAREADPDLALRPGLLLGLLRRRRWALGTAAQLAGVGLQLLALALAPITVVQPTLALGLLVVLGAGRRVLQEQVRPAGWAAAATVVAGVATVAVCAPERGSSHAATGIVVVVAALLALVAAPWSRRSPRRSAPGLLVLGAGSGFALSAVLGRVLVDALGDGRLPTALGVGAGAGLVSGAALLLDQSALQRLPVVRVAPPAYVLETALPVLVAPWAFGERWPGGGASVALALGLLAILAGGGVLAGARAVVGGQGQDDLGR